MPKYFVDFLNEQGGTEALRRSRGRRATEFSADPAAARVEADAAAAELADVAKYAGRIVDEPDRLLGGRFLCDCGRLVDLDMMLDLDDPSIPPGLRVAATVRERTGAGRRIRRAEARRFACDGCWSLWLREPDVPLNRAAFRRAIGAPDSANNSDKPW